MPLNLLPLLLLTFMLIACGEDPARRAPADAGLSDTDSPDSSPPGDASEPDPSRCTAHSECSAERPFCEVESGVCVACLPGLTNQHRNHQTWPGTDESAPNIQAIGALPDNAVVLLGRFSADALPASPTPLFGEGAEFGLARMNPNAELAWVRGIPAQVRAMSTDGSGNIYIVGLASPETDLGGGLPPDASPSAAQSFLLSLSPEGAYRWEQRFATDQLFDVDAHEGRVAIAGAFSESLELGGTSVNADEGATPGFYAIYSDEGEWLDHHVPAPQYSYNFTQIALAQQGRVVVGGTHRANLDLGAGAFDALRNADAFLVAYNAERQHRWQARLSSEASVTISDLKTSAEGQTIAVARAGDSVRVADGMVFNPYYNRVNAGGSIEPFIVSYQDDGTAAWLRSLQRAQPHVSLALDAMNSVYVQGHYALFGDRSEAQVDLGHGERELLGESDAFLAAYSAEGTPLWELFWGQEGSEVQQHALAITSDQRILNALSLRGELDSYPSPLSSPTASMVLTELCIPHHLRPID